MLEPLQPLLTSGARPLDAYARSGGVRHFSTGGDAINRKGALIMRFFAILFVITSLLTTPVFAAPSFPVSVDDRVQYGRVVNLNLNEVELVSGLEGALSSRGWDVRDRPEYRNDESCPIAILGLTVPRAWMGAREEFFSSGFDAGLYDAVVGRDADRSDSVLVGLMQIQARVRLPDGRLKVVTVQDGVAVRYTSEYQEDIQLSIPISINGNREYIDWDRRHGHQVDRYAAAELVQLAITQRVTDALAQALDAQSGALSARAYEPAYSDPVPWPQRQTSVGVGGGGGLRPMAPQGPMMLGGGRPRAGDHVINVPSEDRPLLDQALARGQALPVFVNGCHVANVVGRRGDGRYYFRPVGDWDLPIGAEFEPTYGHP